MDKSSKIRKYQRKDYTAVVEFPVEIIGRDGVVRRYSFEESIRLYQRRIASADLRYRDQDLIKAEKSHCLHRIEQLRRSFFAHYGWPSVQVVDEEGHSTFLAAEVAAFLKRCLSSVDPDPESFTFSKLETAEHYRVFYVQPALDPSCTDSVVDGHFLLYVFQFDQGSRSAARESFFDMIKLLDGVQLSSRSSVEALVAFFHTHDCGLILTGSGSVVERVHEVDLESIDALSWVPDHGLDPVEKGMKLLGQGRLEASMEAFVEAYTAQNFRRVAYLGAAVVADQLGCDAEAETATVMGCQYFPGDPALIYHRALNLLRQGEFMAATETLTRIAEWPHGRSAVRLLSALALLAQGDLWAGQRQLRSLHGMPFRMDTHLAKGARWVRAQIWARDILLALATLVFVLGLMGAEGGALWQLWFSLVGACAWPMIFRSWKRQLIVQLAGPTDRRMRLSSSAVLLSEEGNVPLQ